ncbi:MAG: GAF domain-containing protein [Caldilineae bacterium]|nr:MAG: GAF domain-containing protein [Caldilineae bacterium]
MYMLDHKAGELEARAVAGKEGLVVAGYRQKVGQGITGRAAERGERVLIPDVRAEPNFIACVPNIRSELVLPVWCAGELAGVLNIESDRLNAFDETDIVALEALAGQLGVALENARLFTETTRRASQLEALRQIGLEISAQLELNQVLESIVRRAIELLNGSSGGMYLYNPQQDVLEWTVAIGENLTPIGTILRRGEGVSGKVLDTNAPLVVDDYHHWEGRAAIYADYPFASVVGVPVRWGDEFLGVLDVLADSVGAFSEDDVNLLTLVAAQAAVAIHNARLYEQARRDAETKAVLLKEVNHRVKNNLTAIIGLLYTERRRASFEKHPMYQDFIETIVNRVQGLATVHNLLSASEWQPVRVDELATRLIRVARHAAPAGKEVYAEVAPSPLRIPASHVNNLALVLNELATNSIKHALAAQDAIRLAVDIAPAEDGQSVQITFRDDGPGYPEAVLGGEAENVGLYLVKMLVRDGLRGELSFHNEGGAVTVIRFALEEPLPARAPALRAG